jgi:hypothetical protein
MREQLPSSAAKATWSDRQRPAAIRKTKCSESTQTRLLPFALPLMAFWNEGIAGAIAPWCIRLRPLFDYLVGVYLIVNERRVY